MTEKEELKAMLAELPEMDLDLAAERLIAAGYRKVLHDCGGAIVGDYPLRCAKCGENVIVSVSFKGRYW